MQKFNVGELLMASKKMADVILRWELYQCNFYEILFVTEKL